ncbi:MAG: hypothetical protein M3R70_11245 [Actinomycetota bacterium]|nr:hypothetical protein [Actinomycetota bacterium]
MPRRGAVGIMGLSALLASGLIVTVGPATGGQPRSTAVVPGRTVRSPDGLLTVKIPRGALRKNVRITARVLPRTKWPKEVRRAKAPKGTKFYALEPDGLRFAKPVTITRRFPRGAVSGRLPGIWFASRDGRGRWSLLAGHSVRLQGRTVIASGTTRHFSDVVPLDGGARVSMNPDRYEKDEGESWLVGIKVENARVVNYYESTASGAVVANGGRSFACTRAGTGALRVVVTVRDQTPPALLARGLRGLENDRLDFRTTIAGAAVCRPSILASLTLSPASVTGGTASVATVHLSKAAPAGGLTFSFASDNAAATVTETFTVPEGATVGSVTVLTKAVSAVTTVTISASLGDVTRRAVLVVNPGSPSPVCEQPLKAELTTYASAPHVQITGKCAALVPAGAKQVRVDAPAGSQFNAVANSGCSPATLPSSYVACPLKSDSSVCMVVYPQPAPVAGAVFRARVQKQNGDTLQDSNLTVPAGSQPTCAP